ncbi:Endonuclease, Uma2 family (restriction endonuclease fold) [Micromonospora citrea]|uniref:Endonuclease, Uma2 family (Restriction endonuclease fold) n=1 Tax=Micromonospora citrea TaxID=47855 RepID=A0A1C6VUN1_9ACTN|nr:Uma2 family endonuclease [Micromonospora citrea]SCL69600.1 Endonuclease, Uma2 family (restriction endonuclease fold) [Micromonospora citrea]
MSAEPIATPPDPWCPDPLRQQRADYTLEDLLDLPDDAPRVELVDGVIQVTPSPTLGHQDISLLLAHWLLRHAPGHLRVAQAVGVALNANTSRQPDVLLRSVDVPSDRSLLRPEDVVLAVEIVSPGTRRTDRFAKPGEYAAAGIPFYWRIEQDPVHVYAYRRGDRIGPGGERQYELVADSAELIELTEPFEIKLPVAEIVP